MAETLDISACPVVPVHEAILCCEQACRILQFRGGEIVKQRPLLFQNGLEPENIKRLHDANILRETSDSYTYFVKNAQVGGFGGHAFLNGKLVYAIGSYPYYVSGFVERELSRWHWEIEEKQGEKSVIHLPNGYLISHFNPIYGHWLLEILPKLFAIKELSAQGILAPIILPTGFCSYPILKQSVKLILPDIQIVEYDWLTHNVQVDVAILPSMLNKDYTFNGEMKLFLESYLQPYRSDPGPKNLFVSRSKLDGKFRKLRDASALDRVAEQIGLTIIRPEAMPWQDQIRAFASANVIAGEFGSGLHNSIFSRPGTKTICLNIVNDIQSIISNSFAQDVGYVMPVGGNAVGLEIDWRDQKIYEIDLDEFGENVSSALKG